MVSERKRIEPPRASKEGGKRKGRPTKLLRTSSLGFPDYLDRLLARSGDVRGGLRCSREKRLVERGRRRVGGRGWRRKSSRLLLTKTTQAQMRAQTFLHSAEGQGEGEKQAQPKRERRRFPLPWIPSTGEGPQFRFCVTTEYNFLSLGQKENFLSKRRERREQR